METGIENRQEAESEARRGRIQNARLLLVSLMPRKVTAPFIFEDVILLDLWNQHVFFSTSTIFLWGASEIEGLIGDVPYLNN